MSLFCGKRCQDRKDKKLEARLERKSDKTDARIKRKDKRVDARVDKRGAKADRIRKTGDAKIIRASGNAQQKIELGKQGIIKGQAFWDNVGKVGQAAALTVPGAIGGGRRSMLSGATADGGIFSANSPAGSENSTLMKVLIPIILIGAVIGILIKFVFGKK